MTWQPSSLNWPDSAQTIQSQSEAVLSQVSGKMTESARRVTSLASQVAFTRHPLSSEAQALLNLRAELDSLQVTGQILSVHPYQFEVGRQVESGHHLSPDIAVSVLAEKLLDTHDPYRPAGFVHVVGWMIAEPLLADFATATKALFEVVNIPELGMVARRLEKEQSLQSDKLTQPETIIQPRFRPSAHLNQQPLRDVATWQGAQTAQLESLSSDNQSPVSKLSALAQKRSQKLAELTAAINSLKQNGTELLKFEASGTPDVVATELNQSSPPSRANSYTYAALFISEMPLTFISELFA